MMSFDDPLGPVIPPSSAGIGAPSGIRSTPSITMPLHRRILSERQRTSPHETLKSPQSRHNLRRINEALGSKPGDTTQQQNGTGDSASNATDPEKNTTPSLHPFANTSRTSGIKSPSLNVPNSTIASVTKKEINMAAGGMLLSRNPGGSSTNDGPIGSESPYWVSLGTLSTTGVPIDPGNIPEGRRGHHSTMWTHETSSKANEEASEEFMIVSGGFTDYDWATFPIYAFSTKTNLWLDLSVHLKSFDSSTLDNCHRSTVLPDSPNADSVDENGKVINLWDYAMACPPPPRMSHYTLVHSNHLYVFGGLLYNDHSGMFFMEDRDFVYRIDLHYLLLAARDGLPPGMVKAGWERILPRVIIPPASPSGETPVVGSATYAGNEATASTSSTGNSNNELAVGPNRGEMKGGYFPADSKLVIFGGLRVHDTPRDALGLGRQVDTPLSDLWSYDLETDTWERVVPKRSPSNKSLSQPTSRTSHAADVTGDALIVYGGMSKVEENLWDGSTVWVDLSDVWIFNLTTQEWHERRMYPVLARAYHTIVAWNEVNVTGPIFAAFGGYESSKDPMSEDKVTYVFDDVLVSPPSVDPQLTAAWLKAETSTLDFSDIHPTEAISNRMEHSASLSNTTGEMLIWGGRFRTTEDVDDRKVWSLNVAGSNSKVRYQMAEPDDLFENDDVEAAHVVLAAFMFVGMIVTTMAHASLLQRQMAEDDDDDGDGEGGANVSRRPPRGTGLQQNVIDAHMPVAFYSSKQGGTSSTEEEHTENLEIEAGCSSVITDLDTSTHHDVECQICLIDFSDGDEIRALPCCHQFHTTCVDPWFHGHTSCPACRHDLSALTAPVDRSSILHGFDRPLFGFIRRLMHAGGQDSIDLEDIDASYASSLELSEEPSRRSESGRLDDLPQAARTSIPQDEESTTGHERSRPRRSPSPDQSIGSSRRQRRRRRGGRAMAGRREPLNEYLEANVTIV